VLSPSQAALLRSISIGDESSIRDALSEEDGRDVSLDGLTSSLVRLASLIARGASTHAFQREVQAALDAGATVDDILSLLRVLAQPVGTTAIINAAPSIAMALGYDVENGLEELAP
jgi:4-carboxymuconolactone decarboxylase